MIQDIEEEKIDKILISNNDLEIFYKDGKKALSKKEPEISLSQLFISYGIKEEKLRKVAIEEKEKSESKGQKENF